LLDHGFREGYPQASKNGKERDYQIAFARYCPPCKATTLRKRIVAVSGRAKTRQEGFIQDLAFVSLCMDGGHIGTVQLFLTSLIASNLSDCLTQSITQVDYLDNARLQELLTPLLTALHERDIEVGSIICDGASYQLKALDFRDRASTQARNSEVNLRIVHDSLNFRKLVDSLHRLAGFCRKPNQRRAIGGICPAFTETRWLYDHRIRGFLLHHAEAINDLSGVAT
jgi:hypothetical protein